MASLTIPSRDRQESNAVLTAEPWLVVDGEEEESTSSTTASVGGGGGIGGGGGKYVVKICNAGSVVWSTVDVNSTRSYEFLSKKLELPHPVFVVDENVTNLVRSTEDLQRVLRAHTDLHTPLRLEVYLNNSLKESLLAQSFVFLENFDPEALLQSMSESMRVSLSESMSESMQSRAASSSGEQIVTGSSNSVAVQELAAPTDDDVEGLPTALPVENPEEDSSSANVASRAAAVVDESAKFPYHCSNSKMRGWIHSVFSSHGHHAEEKVLSLKKLYNEVLVVSQSTLVDDDAAVTTNTKERNSQKKTQYEQIDVDIPRTFSSSAQLTTKRKNRDVKLRRILRAVSDKMSSGYVQGQNFIVGYLLTVTEVESDVFALFVGLMDGEAVAASSLSSGGRSCSRTNRHYGLVGMYTMNMPRLNALVYVVDASLPIIAPEMHQHFCDIGISTSLLYVPGWALTMFTNRLNAESVGPLFEQIVHGGYRAIVRLCLATLIAHKEQLMACEFETCLLLLQQHLWTQANITSKIIDSLVSLQLEDEQIDQLETEYATGSATSTSGVQRGRGRRKDNQNKKQASESDREDSSFLGLPGMSRSAATVTGVITATIFAGLGAMMLLGGAETKEEPKQRRSQKEEL